MEQTKLLAASGVIALLHTILGPDHYLPFVAMSRAGRWSTAKTLIVTCLCGLGHVLGSVVLGIAGVLLGVTVLKIQHLDGLRGDLAAWLLLAFGVVYAAWGLRRAARNKPHSHLHAHADGTIHAHPHAHEAEHLHVHPSPHRHDARPWILFVIFLFGPCEPLIPLIMYPAAQGSISSVIGVTCVFALTTLAVMIALVLLMSRGLDFVRLPPLERYTHALAGLTLAACGAAMCAGL